MLHQVNKMKTATITSLLLAAGSSLAAPAKRSGEAITITNFKATESNTAGTISFDIYDPNFSQNDSASVSWLVSSRYYHGMRI